MVTNRRPIDNDDMDDSGDEQGLKRTEEDYALDELMSFALEVQLRQYRTFVFGVMVSSTQARIIRYDRRGTVFCKVDLK